MKYYLFEAFDHNSKTRFLFVIRIAWVTPWVHVGSAMWLFYLVMKRSFDDLLNPHPFLAPTSSSNAPKEKERLLGTYQKMVSYLLQTCATDDVIVENDALMRYTHASWMTPNQDEEVLATKSLWSGEVCDEKVLKGILINDNRESLSRSMRSSRSTNAKAYLFVLACSATSLQALAIRNRWFLQRKLCDPTSVE